MTMPRAKIHIDPAIFNEIFYREIFNDQNRFQIVFGGSSSGKSVSIAQRVVIDLLAGSRNYLCIRNTANTLRGSCFAEVSKIITSWELKKFFKIRESDMEIECVNKYSANFRGLDDVEKLKSFTPPFGVLTDIWIEEATETAEMDLLQLDKRLRGITDGNKTKRIILSFNPILKSHWIFKRFFNGWSDYVNLRRDDSVTILKTTYRDNKFLAADDIKSLENTTDPYMRDVYRDGKWGVLGGAIFPKMRVMDILSDAVFQTFDILRYGMDFGYSNDPTAFNSMYYHRATKRLYIFREWNAHGCTNDQIAEVIKPLVNGSGSVVCDSAEPKSIAELNNHGLPARGAQKGKDSVVHGIQWLQQQEIIIDERCQNTINDFSGYHWKKDKSGVSINIPSDEFSHHCDAVRYACEDLVFEAPADSVYAVPSAVFSVQREMSAIN
jgi:phage terminase large subunit